MDINFTISITDEEKTIIENYAIKNLGKIQPINISEIFEKMLRININTAFLDDVNRKSEQLSILQKAEAINDYAIKYGLILD